MGHPLKLITTTSAEGTHGEYDTLTVVCNGHHHFGLFLLRGEVVSLHKSYPCRPRVCTGEPGATLPNLTADFAAALEPTQGDLARAALIQAARANLHAGGSTKDYLRELLATMRVAT